MGKQFRRRRLIVDRQMQSRIIAQVAWPAALCVMVSVTLMGLFCARVTAKAIEANVEIDGVATMLLACLGFLLVSSGLFLFNCLKVSHRVAGPIYRIRAVLAAVRAGEPTLRIRLRKEDFLGDLAEDLNTFLAWAEPHLPQNEVPEEVQAAEAEAREQEAEARREFEAACAGEPDKIVPVP